MNSLYRFIVKPKKDRYDNDINIGDKKLIVNTTIETFQSVSKQAIVVSVPKAYKTNIKVGDEVIVHHNVFRRFYNIKGKEKNSASFFKDNLFFCDIEQIYLYNNGEWNCNLNYCFVKPVLSTDDLSIYNEKPLTGIIKYTNKFLESSGIVPGTLITFTPDSEFEFIIGGERLYCMKSNNIALTHEYKGDEKEHNPSWAQSG
tara:strand:- start:32 stop:634 length:603 start_codon:yes stop_codon:yes gene_type:complete